MSRRRDASAAEPIPARDPAAGERPADGSAAGAGASALAAVNALLQQAIRDIPAADGTREALASALRLVCQGTGWVCGEAWVPAAEGGDRLQVAETYVTVPRLSGFVDMDRRHRVATGEDLPAVAWRDARPAVVDDVAREAAERFPRRDLARLHGLHTALAVPAIGADGPEAVLVFFADRVRTIEAMLVEGIAAVGALLATTTLCLLSAGRSDLNQRRQSVLSDILALGLREQPIEEVLPEALHLVLALPGLALRPMGAVFLADDGGTELRMAAQENMSAAVRRSCARVPFGTCLCGSAAQSGHTVTTADVDERHSIVYDGMQPHGHYCAPLLAAGRTLGVLCLYTDPGHPPDPDEAVIVESAARALAGLILRARLTGDLALSQASFTKMVRHAPMGLIVVGEDGRIRFANESVERWFALRPGQAVGQRPADYLELRGDEAVLTRGPRTPSLLRVSRTELLWGGEAAEMIVLGDITAERVMEKVHHTLVGAHYPDIARRVIQDGAARYPPEERTISVLFVDMVDSTGVAAARGGDHLAGLLDVLYRLAIETVAGSGGSVNNLVGDAVMATFNAPLELADHPWRAVEAGARFLSLLAAHRRDHPEASFDVHIGIETGRALVGDVGTEDRHLYTVTGECAQFASRLTKLPLPNRVVVGPGTAAALTGQVPFTPYGPIVIRGLDGTHAVYLMGEDPAPSPSAGSGIRDQVP